MSDGAHGAGVWGRRTATAGFGESRLRRCFELLSSHPTGTLVDLACGSGSFGAAMASAGWSVVGIEMFALLATEAAGRIPAVVRADAGRPLPLRTGAFDAVFAGEIIEHLVDTDLFLAEIARILRPGGTAIVTTPNLASFENRVRLAVGRYPRWVDHRIGGEGHVRAYTPRVLRSQMGAHGLEVVTHVGNWVPFVPQRFVDDVRHPWVEWTGRSFPSLAMDIIVEARRV